MIAAGLAVSLGIGNVQSAPTGAGNAAPGVLPPGASPYGASYEEWAAQWVQWSYALPSDMHPLFDTADCSEGQSGSVWFLGGAYVTPEPGLDEVLAVADRDCTIPSGTALFFPVLNTVATAPLTDDGQPTLSEAELRTLANLFQDAATDMYVTLTRNGVDVEMGAEDLSNHRVESPLFTVGPLPADNVPGEPESTIMTVVTDGVYVMLAPLPVGEHELRFGGAFELTVEEFGFDFLFELDITYHLTVVPAGQY